MRVASSRFRASGFSQRTILPAEAAAMAISACKLFGVAMSTTSTSLRSKTARQSVAVSSQFHRRAISSSRVLSLPHTIFIFKSYGVSKNRLTCRNALEWARPMKPCPIIATPRVLPPFFKTSLHFRCPGAIVIRNQKQNALAEIPQLHGMATGNSRDHDEHPEVVVGLRLPSSAGIRCTVRSVGLHCVCSRYSSVYLRQVLRKRRKEKGRRSLAVARRSIDSTGKAMLLDSRFFYPTI